MTAGEMWGTPPAAPSRHPLSKVPEVTAYFWVIKVLTTLMGEATSDYLVHTINPYVAVLLGFAVFAVSLILQFAVRRYVTWIYWFAVSMVAVFGTMAADVLHVALHVPYVASTAFFCVVLVVVFLVWYLAERTLSIHSIYTPRREVFYWAAVVTAFALGTAAGDMTARVVGLGYLGAGVLFTAVIAIPAIAYWRLGLNAIVAFWFAYIVTRPVGASFADYLGFPPSVGGAGIGHGPVALVSALIIAVLVGYLAVTGKDVMTAAARPYPAAPPPPARAADRDPFQPEGQHRGGRHRAQAAPRRSRPMAGAEPEPGEPGPGW
jgi:uncharacterized membrane-anchored protein